MYPANTLSNCNSNLVRIRIESNYTIYPSSSSSLSVIVPQCLFKPKMRFPKRPLSFCLSIFSPPHPHIHNPPSSLSSSSFGIAQFCSGFHSSSKGYHQFPSKRKGFRSKGGFLLKLHL